MQITKELVEKLKTDDITKKEYNEVVAAIGNKVDEIWRLIIRASGRKLDWYAFQNDVSYGRGNGSSGGEFDPETDMKEIMLKGEFTDVKDGLYDHYDYHYSFPTEFLWLENYKEIVFKHLEECKTKSENKKNKQKKVKEDKGRLVNSIKSKLTPEELKVVQFKK